MGAIAAPILTLPELRHGFFTREGGVSEGIYASLNCGLGSRDLREHVAVNRARALNALDLAEGCLNTVHQQHTSTVAVVREDWNAETRPIADAMVTALPGRALGILTADCAPVLFADPEASVIGAAHAGWRGALAGVLDQTVAAMVALGARASRIRAAVGPCIGRDSYQVGGEFVAAFLAESLANESLFTEPDADGRRHFDLPGYVARRLARLGVGKIEAEPPDTCADEVRFFSFRRATLRLESDYGRQLSMIALADR
jgi:YfiH family protein